MLASRNICDEDLYSQGLCFIFHLVLFEIFCVFIYVKWVLIPIYKIPCLLSWIKWENNIDFLNTLDKWENYNKDYFVTTDPERWNNKE